MGAPSFVLAERRNQTLFGFGDAVCMPLVRWLCEHNQPSARGAPSRCSARVRRLMGRPRRKDLPSPQVQEFRGLLDVALDELDESGLILGNAKFGVYAFYNYDGEPIYVGQTNEQLRIRVRRHLTNQRTDAVAMRVLDVFEVAELEAWPLWQLENLTPADARAALDAVEYSVYVKAIEASRYHAFLNEKIPPVSPQLKLKLPTSYRFDLRGRSALEEAPSSGRADRSKGRDDLAARRRGSRAR